MIRGFGLVKRCFCLVLGLFFMGLGISLVTRSALGTSPISSVPYVLCLAFPVTFGGFTIILTLIFFAAEILIIGNAFPKHQYFQIVIALLLGVFVDLGMYLSAGVHPESYPEQIAVVLLGSSILALGIFLQVTANLILNPGEGLVRAIAEDPPAFRHCQGLFRFNACCKRCAHLACRVRDCRRVSGGHRHLRDPCRVHHPRDHVRVLAVRP